MLRVIFLYGSTSGILFNPTCFMRSRDIFSFDMRGILLPFDILAY